MPKVNNVSRFMNEYLNIFKTNGNMLFEILNKAEKLFVLQ